MNIHEETLEIARSLIHKDPSLKDWVVSKFPELNQSKDERIRKSIIDLVEKQMPKSENKKWMIAWLEKQGEQKPAEWGEEDEILCQRLIEEQETLFYYVDEDKSRYSEDLKESCRKKIAWLKSLRPNQKTDDLAKRARRKQYELLKKEFEK